MKWGLYVIIALLAAFALFRGLRSDYAEAEFAISAYGQLPVQVYGRITPIDTVARNTLLLLAKQQTVVRPDGKVISGTEWMMDLVMRPELSDTYRVFKIEFPDELGFAGLAQRGQRHYSFNDLTPFFSEIRERFANLHPEPQLWNAIDKQIAQLHQGLSVYHRVMHSFHPIGNADRMDALIDEYATYRRLVGEGVRQVRLQASGEAFDSELLARFASFGEEYMRLNELAYVRAVPPPPPATPLDDWKTVGLALMEMMHGETMPQKVIDYATLTSAYRAGDAVTFNGTLERMARDFEAFYPDKVSKIRFEWLFNTFQPFYRASALYVLLFLVVLASWLKWGKDLGPAVFWLLVLAFAVHTAGLLARMYISGRPPVTNLYSSAIFVGWGATLIGLVVERFFKNGVGAAVSAIVGVPTLIIAHHLSLDGDTLELMRAVLDSNFWLATHVIVITMGYSAMFLAGAIALVFIFKGVFIRSFDRKEAKSLATMVYGVTCFALLFNVVGTILGGIWADQSWGRFWGWDPKENGALMIVLMGAILLHARWGGIARERGIMALAILGNVVTAWSWFGTNLLGVGLHSYGFTEGGFAWLRNFAISQLVIIGLAYLPFSLWRSQFGCDEALRERKQALRALESPEPESGSDNAG